MLVDAQPGYRALKYFIVLILVSGWPLRLVYWSGGFQYQERRGSSVLAGAMEEEDIFQEETFQD